MSLYYTETVMENGSKECVILEAVNSSYAMSEAAGGHREDGKKVAYVPVKRKVSKAQALKLIEDGARCWASI